jgi:hypothetical protein
MLARILGALATPRGGVLEAREKTGASTPQRLSTVCGSSGGMK